MKRVCTETEKELLYKNRDQMLDDIFWTATRSNYGSVFVGLVISGIIALAGMLVTAIFLFPGASKLTLTICMGIIYIIAYVIYFIITSNLKVKKEAKAFLKKKDLMINEATIVEADGAAERFSYIEDDFRDEEGRPIIIDYPSCPREITPEDVGKRILIMYDGNSNFQLIRVNEELRSLVKDYSPDYPLAEDISEYMRVPHPNMADIDKEGHDLSESEKKKFADLYVRIVRGISFKMAKTGLVVLFVSLVVICILLNGAEGGYPLSQTLPFAVIGYAGLVVFFWLMSCIGKVNIRRQADFVHVKEVVFHSYVIKEHSATVHVYEWNDGQVQMCDYFAGNVSAKTMYGNKLYKFTTPKGKEVLLNTNPV